MQEESICRTYLKCGGCSLQHMSYDEQLAYKTKQVEQLVRKVLGEEIRVCPTIGMRYPYAYRNKSKYVLGIKKGKNQMGFFEEGTHKIVDNEQCRIQNEITNEIAKDIFAFINQYGIRIYEEDKKKGTIRYIVIRIGVVTKEIMVILVTTNTKIGRQKELVGMLTKKYPNIKTIVQNINEKETNAILGEKTIKLYGSGMIYDKLGGYQFKISPLSFYQVNPLQAEVLYQKAIEGAKLNGDEIVYDLYCGIGTITLFLAKHVKKVYGVESVKDAVRDAIENKKLNQIRNVEFVCGRVENVLPKLVRETQKPDVVVVDPPRSGLDQKTLDMLVWLKARKIVYISCNPETFVRDVKVLIKHGYEAKEIQPVDMFPQTSHVECCSVLYLRDSIQ